MKKSTLIGLSVLSVFILCSLSYQPIIAEETITTNQLKQSLKDEILNTKTIEEDDCGCSSIYIEEYPRIICFILEKIFFSMQRFAIWLAEISDILGIPLTIILIPLVWIPFSILLIGAIIDCPFANWFPS